MLYKSGSLKNNVGGRVTLLMDFFLFFDAKAQITGFSLWCSRDRNSLFRYFLF